MEERKCKICSQTLPLSSFYKSQLSTCKGCVAAKVRANRAAKVEYYREYDRQRADRPDRVEARQKYCKTSAYKSSHAQANADYRARNKEKQQAHGQLAHAINMGRVQRQPCVCCGSPKSEGHHEDYSKPLDVVWLCDTHHKARHRQLNKARREGVVAMGIDDFVSMYRQKAVS